MQDYFVCWRDQHGRRVDNASVFCECDEPVVLTAEWEVPLDILYPMCGSVVILEELESETLFVLWSAVPGAEYTVSLHNLTTNAVGGPWSDTEANSFRILGFVAGHQYRIEVVATVDGVETRASSTFTVAASPTVTVRYNNNRSDDDNRDRNIISHTVPAGTRLSDIPITAPTVSWHRFMGWSESNGRTPNTLGDVLDPDTLITKDMDLYARWSIAPAQLSSNVTLHSYNTDRNNTVDVAGLRVRDFRSRCQGVDGIPICSILLDKMRQIRSWAIDEEIWDDTHTYSLNSAYRTPERNASATGSGASSQHMAGRAVDIAVPRGYAEKFVEWAHDNGMPEAYAMPRTTPVSQSTSVHIDTRHY